jgi:hypothetical protein
LVFIARGNYAEKSTHLVIHKTWQKENIAMLAANEVIPNYENDASLQIVFDSADSKLM